MAYNSLIILAGINFDDLFNRVIKQVKSLSDPNCYSNLKVAMIVNRGLDIRI